jgi:hypothetical protein
MSVIYFEKVALFISYTVVRRAILKMLRRKSKMQFVKQEHDTQNAIALLNYLKRIAPQQLMLTTQVFTKNFFAQRTHPQLCKIRKYLVR